MRGLSASCSRRPAPVHIAYRTRFVFSTSVYPSRFSYRGEVFSCNLTLACLRRNGTRVYSECRDAQNERQERASVKCVHKLTLITLRTLRSRQRRIVNKV